MARYNYGSEQSLNVIIYLVTASQALNGVKGREAVSLVVGGDCFGLRPRNDMSG
jgi:hypothetical protein